MFWKAYLSIQEAAVSFALTELGCSGGRGLLFQYSECMSHVQQWTSIGFYLNHWAGMLFKSFSSLPEGEVLECFLILPVCLFAEQEGSCFRQVNLLSHDTYEKAVWRDSTLTHWRYDSKRTKISPLWASASSPWESIYSCGTFFRH